MAHATEVPGCNAVDGLDGLTVAGLMFADPLAIMSF